MVDSPISALEQARRIAKFLGPDPDLNRYTRTSLEEYIQDCCEKNYLIEAYSVALQYIEDLFYFAIKERQDDGIQPTNVPQILGVFKSLNLIDEDLERLYKRINETRNKLSHKIVRDASYRQQISKIDKSIHVKDLKELISSSEKFFLKFAKLFPKKFLIKLDMQSSIDKVRHSLLIDIFIEEASKKITIPFDEKTDIKQYQESLKKFYHDEILLMFTETFKQ